MAPILQVAFGGALGAVARFLTVQMSARVFGAGFPMGTLLVNALGCFLMGVLAVYMSQSGGRFAPFWMTGVLGGFTTYSAFSLDALKLYENGQLGLAALYVGGTLLVALAGVALGAALMKGGLS